MLGACAELELVLDPVRDDVVGDARLNGCFGNGFRDHVDQAGIEGGWDDVLRSIGEPLSLVGASNNIRNFLLGEVGEGQSGGHLHFFVDLGSACV